MDDLFKPQAAPRSIFSVVSERAKAAGAVNLGQGFPDFEPDKALLDRLAYHVKHGHNQYAPLAGVPKLLTAIAAKVQRCHGVILDAPAEINITAGATQAIWTSMQAILRPGDEVMVFEPAYDSYVPAVRQAGAVVVPMPLVGPSFRPDWADFASKLSDRTRLVVLNNPHNPSGTCWREEDLSELERQLTGTQVAVLSDEVYEHLVYDEKMHRSVLVYPELRRRAFVTCSFGKTFHITGWKVGYVIAPPPLMQRFRAVHQFTVFTVNTPAQYAIADFLQDSSHYESLAQFMQAKRDQFANGLSSTALRVLPSEGSYFCLVDYGEVSQVADVVFAERLIKEAGVATIPISPFYSYPIAGQTYVRVCFAKRSTTIDQAVKQLQAYCKPG